MIELETRIVNGRAVRYADAGDRMSDRVLVLIHAFPMGVQMWSAGPLSSPGATAGSGGAGEAGLRVITPALAGFDGSDRLDAPSMDAYARQVVGLLDDLGVPRAVFCGLSMGGYVTFGILRVAPHRAAGIILADTRAGADSPEVRAARHQMLGLLASGGPSAVARDMLPKLLGSASREHRPEVGRSLQQMIEAQTAGAVADAIHAMLSRPDSGALLRELRLPALILVGEEDVLTPPAEADAMHAAIAGSILVRIPGAGHMANMEAPEAFNEAVTRFLMKR
jgi:pimeloyl-ACP methyl ester carboxylesterase